MFGPSLLSVLFAGQALAAELEVVVQSPTGATLLEEQFLGVDQLDTSQETTLPRGEVVRTIPEVIDGLLWVCVGVSEDVDMPFEGPCVQVGGPDRYEAYVLDSGMVVGLWTSQQERPWRQLPADLRLGVAFSGPHWIDGVALPQIGECSDGQTHDTQHRFCQEDDSGLCVCIDVTCTATCNDGTWGNVECEADEPEVGNGECPNAVQGWQ